MIGYHHVLMIIIALAIILLCKLTKPYREIRSPRMLLECF